MNDPFQRIVAVFAAVSTVPEPARKTTRFPVSELVEPADTAAPLESWHFVAHVGCENTPALSGFSTVTSPDAVE
ncbi:hypothetical protein [Streptomyces tagetis]|uniref:hypothetical protein n=1 Tax=Streptomyces tagetis TaxID=2820809 RepID=UPI001FF9D568|nr:hypothetical protein [Streptomyces sp. RG38]